MSTDIFRKARNGVGIGTLFSSLRDIDWILFLATLPLLFAGLITVNSFSSENILFDKQLVWATLSIGIFFLLSMLDFRFLRRTNSIIGLFLICVVLLLALFVLGSTVHGARSWFHFGSFAFQPSDPAKLIAILLLAKYFSKRHVEIAHLRHILISGAYTFTLFLLIFLEPDFGSAVIILLIWFGMVLVSGISKKHLLGVLLIGAVAGAGLWFYVFEDYQKARILTFVHPLTDVRGAGYNAYQSTIAVGSGELLGRGVGYGTQSRLQFLPEYETDFIFAAFAEEWGFVGVLLLFASFGVLMWRILANAMRGATNFEMLYGVGLAVLLMSHFAIHIGMNIGLLPVTGITMPFLSYGGSHLLTEYAGLGILMGMRRYRRPIHREALKNEFVGV
ncbi:MAG TPA: rod shape-determining protein RodA [Candidatus Paceibacterota bacterium]